MVVLCGFHEGWYIVFFFASGMKSEWLSHQLRTRQRQLDALGVEEDWDNQVTSLDEAMAGLEHPSYTVYGHVCNTVYFHACAHILQRAPELDRTGKYWEGIRNSRRQALYASIASSPVWCG
jgi:hypothetical protein